MLETLGTNVLVVAAHPDDEVLGCGGTIARLVDCGVEVHIALLADGVGSRKKSAIDAKSNDNLIARRQAARKAAKILGAKSVVFGDFPDNRMDTIALLEITQFIEQLIARIQPETVFTHHAGDLNVDHRLTSQAVMTACRPIPNSAVHTVLFFEVPSSTEWQMSPSNITFEPNFFLETTAQLDRRQLALEAYAEEIRPWPHIRSYEALNHLSRWRGATVGVEAAEAFMLGRKLLLA
jgi:LmbE family N-acetylglucosaminyl deacetylase